MEDSEKRCPKCSNRMGVRCVRCYECGYDYFSDFDKKIAVTKETVNYRKQNDDYDNRRINCDNCANIFRATPYKNRCVLLGMDLQDKKLSVSLESVCDKFQSH